MSDEERLRRIRRAVATAIESGKLRTSLRIEDIEWLQRRPEAAGLPSGGDAERIARITERNRWPLHLPAADREALGAERTEQLRSAHIMLNADVRLLLALVGQYRAALEQQKRPHAMHLDAGMGAWVDCPGDDGCLCGAAAHNAAIETVLRGQP